MDVLGEALHAFLAFDRRDLPHDVRADRAKAILERRGVAANLRPSDAVSASNRLWDFLHSRFSGAHVRREVPVHARMGSQEVAGRIDMLVETGEFLAIIDHKSFPGRHELWDDKAISHAPQLAIYADAVASVTGNKCCGTFVHMPLIGIMAEAGITLRLS